MNTAVAFVNIHGQAVDVTPVKQKRVTKEKEAHHDGWLATGVSPAAVEKAKEKAKFEKRDFDLQHFLRTAKREKIRTKPYFNESSARVACELAEKSGWMNFYTIEKKAE